MGIYAYQLTTRSRRLKMKAGTDRVEVFTLKYTHKVGGIGWGSSAREKKLEALRDARILKSENAWYARPLPQYVVMDFCDGAGVYTNWPSSSKYVKDGKEYGIPQIEVIEEMPTKAELFGFLREDENGRLVVEPWLKQTYDYPDADSFRSAVNTFAQFMAGKPVSWKGRDDFRANGARTLEVFFRDEDDAPLIKLALA